MITRRQMLARLLGGSVALAAADIWIPGERSIFLPARTLKISDLVWAAGSSSAIEVTFVPPVEAIGSWLDRLALEYGALRLPEGETDAALKKRALERIRLLNAEAKVAWCEDRYIVMEHP